MLAWLGGFADAWNWWTGVAVFLVLAAVETLRPERRVAAPLVPRWGSHFALYGLCLLLVAAAVPAVRASVSAVLAGGATPLGAAARRGGDAVALIASLLLLDLFLYALHRAEHAIFLLWRFHAVHHTDPEVDVSTALRHHPGEFLANAAITMAVFVALGVPLWALPVYGLISLAAGLFQHVNSALPPRLERALALVIVSPAMHRVHHSAAPEHFGSNFGNVFSVWDRLFGTFRALPADEQGRLVFGLPGLASAREATLLGALHLPFRLQRFASSQSNPARRSPSTMRATAPSTYIRRR